MMDIQIFVHPYLQIHTKCFLIRTAHYNVWIDTGLRGGWDDFQSACMADGRQNVALLTHGHWDHIGGVSRIRRSGGTVYGHEADRRELTDPDWQWLWQFGQLKNDFDLPPARKTVFYDSIEPPMDLDCTVTGGDVLEFDSLRFRVIAVPGHSAGSVCYLEEGSGILFVGDAIMGNGFFTGTPQISDFDAYCRSMERVKRLRVSRVFTAHTDPVDGTELFQLAQTSQDCAARMRRAAEDYVKSTDGPVTVRDAARAIARTEGKNVGGGTCVSALAALWQMDDPRAKACASGYICGT